MAVWNGVVVVGALGDDDGGLSSGSAYLYEQGGDGAWLEKAKLTASDAAASDQIGNSVAVSNGVVVVGARQDGGGSAYLYEQGGDRAWIETAKLTASDATASDQFGWSVAVSNGVVVVGAWQDDDAGTSSGSAYLFKKDGGGCNSGNWMETKLTAFDSEEGDHFGYSVVVSNGAVFVGARGDDDAGSYSGSVYIFDIPDIAILSPKSILRHAS